MASKELRVLWHLSEVIAFRGHSSEEVFRRFLDQRDDQAFHELLRRHGKAVYLQCKAVLRSEDLVHEAFQTTFISLALKGHTIKLQGNVGGWLVKTARNAALNIQRGMKTRQKIEQSFGAELADNLSDSKVKDLARQAEVFAFLSELPENYRAVLTLCVIHGATHAEAASKLRWPMGTVATRVSKGLEMLKKKLQSKGWGAAGAILPVILASNVEAVPPDVSRAAIETAMKAMSVHTGWKILVAGLWGAFLGYWTWVVAGVILLGLGLGTLAYANRPLGKVIASDSSSVKNIKLLRQQIHQNNQQVFRTQVIPKVVAALQKIKLWNEPVKVVDVSEKDFILMIQVEQQAKFGSSSKPWLTTRTVWHYNVLTGAVYINLDLQGDNNWRATSVDRPIRYDNPFTGKPAYLAIPELLEAKKAFELLTPEPFEYESESINSDPKLQTLRPYLGRWYSDNEARHPAVIFVTEAGLPRSIESDGRIYALQLLPDQKRWFLENFGILRLSEDKQVLSSDLGCRWRR